MIYNLLRWSRTLLVAGAALLASLSPARADDAEQAAAYAVQNRTYRLGHELHAAIGVLPINAFAKGLTVGGGYTYHMSSLWAWEVAQFVYSFNFDTSLKNELLTNFQVQPTQIESIDYFASSTFLLKPFYGKFSAFNRAVVHAELFFALGGGFAKYSNPSAFRPGFDAGAGLRFHLARYLSLRLDVRNYGFFKGLSLQNELYVALAMALSFGGPTR